MHKRLQTVVLSMLLALLALPAWAPGDPPLPLGVAVPSEQADEARVATVAEALAEAAGRLTNPWRERAATERP